VTAGDDRPVTDGSASASAREHAHDGAGLETIMSGPHEWDADVYHRVSDTQLGWGREVLDRLPLAGTETVLDAGCGSGRVTLELADRLPRGRVIAVDGSADMVRKAREVLPERCEVVRQDLAELELAEPADAVFSNAVFHWLPDHDRLFERLHAALRPGGRMRAQCGGEGNVALLRGAVRELAAQEPFRDHLVGWESPWNFSSAEAASARLERTGFTAVSCWLERRQVAPADPRAFLATVSLGVQMEHLPGELQGPFVDAVMKRLPEPVTLEYVRLNIDAERPVR
jgi:trans-aconitate 2-methyltransferase